MSFFQELRRGYRDGRSGAPAQPGPTDFDDEEPLGSADNVLAKSNAVIAGLRAENAGLKARVTELQAECERATTMASAGNPDNAKILAQMSELESIIAFPGAWNALVKALHPDTGTGGDILSRTAVFQKLMAACERLGVRR